MATDWTRAKQLDKKTQSLIFGFVRESQDILSKDSLYSIISELIIWIILSFYEIKDEWDKVSTHKSYKIDGDLLITTKSDNIWAPRSAFLKQSVSSGIFTCRFRIENCVEFGKWNDFIIGVIDDDADLKQISDTFYGEGTSIIRFDKTFN